MEEFNCKQEKYYKDSVIDNDITNGLSVEQLKHNHGITVIFPKDDELQIDIDDGDSLKRFYNYYGLLIKNGVVSSYKMELSKTVGHYHITVKLSNNSLTLLEKSALQVFLGSDPKREEISLRRHFNGEDRVFRFFEYNNKESDNVF
jgi:hypothetical protein